MNPTEIILITLGPVAGLALAGLILFMACALWGADRISFPRSVLVAFLQYLVFVPVTWGALALVGGPDPAGWAEPGLLLTAAAIALPVSLVVLVALLRGLASVPVRYGVVIWFLQQLLTALFAALAAGVVFVGLAVYQVTRDPAGRDMLIQGGVIFGAVVAVLAALILGMSVLRSRPR
jgi:hypothetical protein